MAFGITVRRRADDAPFTLLAPSLENQMRYIPPFLVFVFASPLLAGEKKADTEPMKLVELKVLDRLIGSWKDEATFKVAEWTKEEKRETGTFRNSWTLNGRFVESRGRLDGGKDEELQLMTYDVDNKVYRRWYFDSSGNVSESTGKWDAKTSTLTWTSDLGDGITAVSEWRIGDKDTAIWSRIAKDKKGKIYLEIEGKSTRQK